VAAEEVNMSGVGKVGTHGHGKPKGGVKPLQTAQQTAHIVRTGKNPPNRSGG